MSKLVRKSHNVSVLLYHYVCPAKYRKVVFDTKVDGVLKEVCLEIAKRYPIEFIETGTESRTFSNPVDPTIQSDEDHTDGEGLTAREIFKREPKVKKKLWAENSGRMGIM